MDTAHHYREAGRALVHDDRADRLSLVHQIESFIDLIKLEHVGDHRIDLDFSVHVPVDDLRNVGAAFRPAESGAAPDAAGHKLEWTSGDFLAGLRHADDDAFAP